MQENSAEIMRILEQGKLYICGDGSKMAPDVESCLQKAYQNIHSASREEARQWLEIMQNEGRYVKDVWANN